MDRLHLPAMGYSNQDHAPGNGSNWIAQHSLLAAVIIYALLCIPSYFWLQGPVATVGHVPVSVAIGGLVFGSILIVPVIMSLLENRFTTEHKFTTENE
jgi:hypothetical protein